MDFQALKMTIPSEHENTQFKDHCTILKGPSRISWYHENKVFEEVAETHLDAATKNAFQCDSLRVDRHETCGHAHHLFVFPVGTVLDNNIFQEPPKILQLNAFPSRFRMTVKRISLVSK